MRIVVRAALGVAVGLAAVGLAAGCGKAGSSGTKAASSVKGAGCAPVAGQQLVMLTDDKKLQASDNVIPAVNAKAADPALLAALDKVSAAVGPKELVGLNKATDVDRKTPKVVAQDFATSSKLTDGIAKGAGGKITIGAANFSENQTLGELYRIALEAAGYQATVQQIGNRELYEPALEKGEIQVVPEYAGTLTEFLNKKVNGASAAPLASGDIDKTAAALTDLGSKVGLKFGKPSQATDQNAFAVTKALADKYKVKTLSDFADKCSGKATVLGGPAECPQRPFCQPGLEKTYGIQFGSFASLDAGGPQTKTALTSGTASIGLVFSSDAAFATS
ncbi:glycine/betaine ABC transporter substrate-binding protein [Planosporangium thailandense]|uniref:Glycine/betaine ABC transporter substrate-binding protein n=1 Tax=Planosporangium thailandense TaxID=765197 RepID=A0ABX0XTA3_9ACTN|nr:glycine betaine ABC transporter substrate-binding protein [Planosporangium thailandense]NJC69208.1 glycine/betaine ABC transporter substrate-binding protein [Planosporangium thailandense]